MKNRIYTMIIEVVFTLYGYAQTNGDEHKIPEQSSPADSANYRMTIDWKFRDLNGGVQTHNITNWKVRQLSQQSYIDNAFQLEDVRWTVINEQGQNTRKLDELEGLTFQIQGDNFTKLDFYKDVLPAHVNIFRTFVQDKVGFDVTGQMYLDSLRLNIPFYPDFFQNQQADFEQSVSFTNQGMNITWLGYSKINGKDCILLHVKSMFNPFRSEDDMMITNGRSCYWQNIWILPDTRQIEYAVMNEDIVSVTKLKGNDIERQNYIQREVIYEKVE